MKIAVITGASSGMGRDFVYAIDKEYVLDEIWVIARREERLKELQSACKAKIRPLALDLMCKDSFDKYKGLLEECKPEIQVLVNGAGFGLFGEFMKMDLDKQLDIIELNTKALTAMCYFSIPYMPEGSHLVNLASNSSWQPVPYINVYGSSVYSDRVNPSARTNCTTFTKKQNRFHGRCASPISFILQIFLFQSVN